MSPFRPFQLAFPSPGGGRCVSAVIPMDRLEPGQEGRRAGSPSRRTSGLFRSFRRPGKLRSSGAALSPTRSPGDGQASPSRMGQFLDSFRPRSKSDSRAKHQTNRNLAMMQSIPSVDEAQLSPTAPQQPPGGSAEASGRSGVARPLFVDTQLANRSTERPKRSPARQAVIDFVRGGSSRMRSNSASQNMSTEKAFHPHHHHHPRTRTSPFESIRSPGWKSLGGHGRLMAQQSLDSGLEPPQSPNAAFLCKEFFPDGSQPMALNHTMLLAENVDMVYSLFMKAHKCYDLVPTSTKLVVFDTQLPVRKAFFALVYNGVRAAPLWDSVQREFVGMLTITDFIHILHRYYKSGGSAGKELEEHRIVTWREVLSRDGRSKPFTSIDPTESLHKAVQTLCEQKVHRLPVMDKVSGNVLYILTHKRILRFLFLYMSDLPHPPCLDRTPRELGIGTWENVETVQSETPLIQVLRKFLDNRVSALPIVDKDGRVIDIYAKFDVINLAADKAYTNLDISVQEALKHRSDWFEGVSRCLDTDSLGKVIDTIVKAEVHRLVITDSRHRVAGMVSLSDILLHLILSPHLFQDGSNTGEEMDI